MPWYTIPVELDEITYVSKGDRVNKRGIKMGMSFSP